MVPLTHERGLIVLKITVGGNFKHSNAFNAFNAFKLQTDITPSP
jgi:hypothetical protein